MCFLDLGVAIFREAFSLNRKNMGDSVLTVFSERQPVVACTAWTKLSAAIGIVGLPGKKAFIYSLEMLKLLIVHSEKERWNAPICIVMRTPVLDCENREGFA